MDATGRKGRSRAELENRSQAARGILEVGTASWVCPGAVTGINELPFSALVFFCYKARFLGKRVQLAKLGSDTCLWLF